jgi:adenosylcobinamide-GDP ribazoletransferase
MALGLLDLSDGLGHSNGMLDRRSFQSAAGLALLDLLACLRFYSRVALPTFRFETAPHDMPDFSRAVRMLPLAGALIGLCGALGLVLAHMAMLPPLASAALCVGILLRVTGGFHEDGLADCADGFGGGSGIDRKLEIMRDSRIGTFGAAALFMTLFLRIILTASILEGFGPRAAAVSIIAAAAVSRVAGLLPLALLPPARRDGVGFAARQLPLRRLALTALFAVLLALILCDLGAIDWRRTTIASLAAGLAGLYIAVLSRQHIGGHTGDVNGAAQQLAELAFLISLLLFWTRS